jgi:hypothetical protein
MSAAVDMSASANVGALVDMSASTDMSALIDSEKFLNASASNTKLFHSSDSCETFEWQVYDDTYLFRLHVMHMWRLLDCALFASIMRAYV